VRLCNLRRGGRLSLGVRAPGGIVDVEALARARGVAAPASTDEAVRGGDLAALRALVQGASADARFLIREGDAAFGPCIAAPQKILMQGLNYRRHCAEVKLPFPKTPTLFNKYPNALLGHGGTIPLPVKVARQFDYEAELVVVIGKEAHEVSEADALSYVFGYCGGNDFSARDLQFTTTQWMLGKISDGFAPVGPWLVTADEVPDPQRLRVECRVNGEVRQSSSTSDMVFSCAQLVAYVSQHLTLVPGDILFTGTPEGVIQGRPEAERVWLKPGDELTTTVGDFGELRFRLG